MVAGLTSCALSSLSALPFSSVATQTAIGSLVQPSGSPECDPHAPANGPVTARRYHSGRVLPPTATLSPSAATTAQTVRLFDLP
jgi:hypothetical protein